MRLKWPSQEQLLYAVNVFWQKCFFRPKPNQIDCQTILVVKLDEIGDMVCATGVFAALQIQYPKAQLTVLCKPFVKPLIEHDPHIDQIICKVSEWQSKYDLVVELRGTWRTWLKAISYWPHLRTSRAEVRWYNRGQQLHEYQTNALSIAAVVPGQSISIAPRLYWSNNDAAAVNTWLSKNIQLPLVIIHAGARKPLRQWGIHNFAALADWLIQDKQCQVVWIGSQDESEVVSSIQALMQHTSINQTGQWTLSETAYILSKAHFYVGNESGPLQMAASFQLPMVALFGPGVPNVFYPTHKQASILHEVLPCNPCDQVHCQFPNNPCIQRISLNAVKQAVNLHF